MSLSLVCELPGCLSDILALGGEAWDFGHGPTARSATQCAGHGVAHAVEHRRRLGVDTVGTDGAAAKPTLTAQHCGATSHVCTDETRISDIQRRKIAEMAMLSLIHI